GGLAAEAPAGERERGEDPEDDRTGAREGGDDRARLQRVAEVGVGGELAVPVEGEPRERERRDRRLVEGEDQQDHDRRVEEEHDQREEDAQDPAARGREGGVVHSAVTCRGWRKRAKTRVRTETTPSRKSASTEPVSQSGKPVPNRSTIWLPYMYPLVPPTSEGVMNSPSVGMKTNRNAAKMPGRESGNVTLRKAWRRLAPRSLAASSRRRSRLSSETKIGRATNGSQI